MKDPTRPRRGLFGTLRARNRSDVVKALDVLRRFDARGPHAMGVIGVLSFVGGLAEAGILVLVTSVAVNATEHSKSRSLGPFELSNHQLLLAAFGLLLVSFLLSLVISRLAARTVARASLNARQELLSTFHAASYQRKTQDRVAGLQEALTTYVDRFTAAFTSLSNYIAALLNLVSFGLAAMVVSIGAALALALVGLLLLLVIRPAAKRTRAAVNVLTAQRQLYAEGATESVMLARELSVFGVSGAAGERLKRVDEGVAAEFERTRYLAALTPRLYQAVAFGCAIIGLAFLTSSKDADLAAIGAVVLLLVRSLSFGQQVLSSLQQLSEYLPFTDRLMDLMRSYESEQRHQGTIPVGQIERIDLQRTAFAYVGGEPALHDVDLSIAAGETLGVVGPSGAGKTTLVNLLLRLYEPTQGTILINGVSLREVDDDEWHRRTAIVPQEPRLIHGTIADNIRFLRPLDDQTVRRAAEEANISEFIDAQPDGFDAQVGELGIGLSGGQRQRICIARALAGHPDLLVLDEPTSALDGESEAAVQRTLELLKGRVTMVIVAHRLSTLSICDRLAIFQAGELAHIGTSAELQASSAYYLNALRLAGL